MKAVTRRTLAQVAVGALALGGGNAWAAPGRFDAAIHRLAAALERGYVKPDVGRRYAAMLRRNLASGAYANVSSPEAIAQRLTADLFAVAPDNHLRVRTQEQEDGPRRGGARKREPAISDARWLEAGVAYVRFTGFPGDPESVAAVDAFMRGHADAEVLIIDVRRHPGGGMEEMKVILPYLFPRETPLVAMDVVQSVVDRNGPPPDEGPSVRRTEAPPGFYRRVHFATPHPEERRLFDAKVYYLTSRRTASAAEHLALALKRTKRGVLVGERTAGANYMGGYEPLGEGLIAFVPGARVFDPDTGKDWEGVGVEPDIQVPPDQALEVALRHARGAAV